MSHGHIGRAIGGGLLSAFGDAVEKTGKQKREDMLWRLKTDAKLQQTLLEHRLEGELLDRRTRAMKEAIQAQAQPARPLQ